MMCVQLMTNALSLKDNANNVYMDNVNKRGTFEGVRLTGQEEKKVSLLQQRDHFCHRTIDISIKQCCYVHSMYYITAHK